MGQPKETTFDCQWKSWLRMKNLAFPSCNNHLFFFEIYKRGLQHAESVVLSKRFTHYGLQSGFPYNLTTPI